jgi:hypothetical protein
VECDFVEEAKSGDGDELVARHAKAAEEKVPSLKAKRISPHVVRYVLSFNYVLSLVLFLRFLIYFPSCSDQLG